VRHISITDAPVGRSIEETMRTLEALQFTDKNGEVCPANWKPGAETMKPTAEGVKA
jgi:alkyl hydroperoxide reductase subunit AhpC